MVHESSPSTQPLRPSAVPAHALRGLDVENLLGRYATHVPRYTSYPSAPVWRDTFPVATARDVVTSAGTTGPLSLYVHLPFCRKLCHYCGCNMLVTRSESLVDAYLAALEREIATVASLARPSPVVQMHWGGGTPTFLSSAQLARVHAAIAARFRVSSAAEQSIEIHPPVTTVEQIETLARLGFNRVSMGVQDFNDDVQRAVNRIQPFEQTRMLVDACRANGFRSVNIDLMYGLPLQTPGSFAETLRLVERIRPDRIALFGYAHVPSLKKHQKRLEQYGLPPPADRLTMFSQSSQALLDMGYVFIGLDHFALPSDELVRARREGTLQRNFMGYTTCAQTDLIGMGASAISDVGGAYLQNERDVRAYIATVATGGLAVTRGWLPTDDDHIRRAALHQVFCNLRLDFDVFDAREGVDSRTYFSTELERLHAFDADGLVELDGRGFRVTTAGQFFLRNIASVFDAHLQGSRTMSQSV